MSALARRSAVALGLLFGLDLAVGIGLMWLIGLPVSYAIVFAMAVAVAQYAFSPTLIDYVYTIRWTAPEEVSREFAAWYVETCRAAGIAEPRFGVIINGNPNAFTYGRTRGDARVVVTSGLVQLLSPEELRAVVAHELGHVANLDFIVMTLPQVVPLALYVLYVWTRERARDVRFGYIVAIAAYAAYMVSQFVVLVLALSRIREFFADGASARLTRDPNGLAEALIKIAYGQAREHDLRKRGLQPAGGPRRLQKTRAAVRGHLSANGVATLGIASAASASRFVTVVSGPDGAFSETAMANAMRWEIVSPWAKWFQLNSTHPLIANRVLALNEAAAELGVSPQYGLKTDQSKLWVYTGSFLTELFTYALPAISTIASLLLGFAHYRDASSWFVVAGYGLIGYAVGWFIKTALVYPRVEAEHRTVQSLVADELNASPVTAVPCFVDGKIIGRGKPGVFWSNDLVLADSTGFIRLQYRQPLKISEYLIGWLNGGEYMNRTARVHGWYRRGPVPYIEISKVEIMDSLHGNVRSYYRWGVFVFAPVAMVIGAILAGLL